MSKVTALYHIVFCTRYRQHTLPDELREDVYRFIWNVVKKHDSRLIRIGGISNHIHMLIDLNPNVKLSELVRDVKATSSGWLRRDRRFTRFDSWAKEYFAETVSCSVRDSVVAYIKGQVEHHRVKDFNEEIEELFALADISYNPHDMTE